MKKILVFLFGASIFLNPGISALAAPSYPKSDLTCTNTTMIGLYGFQATGNILPGGEFPPGLFVAAGYYKFDGQGNVNGAYYVSFNGKIVEYSDATGTYNVNENCTLDMNIKNSDI